MESLQQLIGSTKEGFGLDKDLEKAIRYKPMAKCSKANSKMVINWWGSMFGLMGLIMKEHLRMIYRMVMEYSIGQMVLSTRGLGKMESSQG